MLSCLVFICSHSTSAMWVPLLIWTKRGYFVVKCQLCTCLGMLSRLTRSVPCIALDQVTRTSSDLKMNVICNFRRIIEEFCTTGSYQVLWYSCTTQLPQIANCVFNQLL